MTKTRHVSELLGWGQRTARKNQYATRNTHLPLNNAKRKSPKGLCRLLSAYKTSASELASVLVASSN